MKRTLLALALAAALFTVYGEDSGADRLPEQSCYAAEYGDTCRG